MTETRQTAPANAPEYVVERRKRLSESMLWGLQRDFYAREGPEAWKPPRKAYWCAYAKRWIGIKHYWSLSVTDAERSALEQMLGTCGR